MRDFRRSPSVNPTSRNDFLGRLAVMQSKRSEGVAGETTFVDLIQKVFKTDLRILYGEDLRRRIDELFEDMRSSSTLTRTTGGDGWIFSHNSLREFMVSRTYISSLVHERILNDDVPVSPVMRTFVASMPDERFDAAITKFGALWQQRRSIANAGTYLALCWDAIVARNAFLNAGIESESDEQHARNLLLDGVTIKSIDFSATIFGGRLNVNGAGSEFSECVFENLVLDGSNISERVFDSVIFRQVDFSNCNLNSSFFFECEFFDCKFAGAQCIDVELQSTIRIHRGAKTTKHLEGEEIIGFFAFEGAKTNRVSDYLRLMHHPRFSIIDKILQKLSEQRNCQLRGLTQRGEAQLDPPFARDFVEMMSQNDWIGSRQDMVGLTADGRKVVSRFLDSLELDQQIVEFMDKH